jgi:hypothetical protein
VIATTHRDDAAEQLYARTEHWVERKRPADPDPILDRVYRIYPTGTGTLKLLVTDRGAQVTPENYGGQLRSLEQALVWALDPNEPKQRQRIEKWKVRTADRYRAVEALRDGYTLNWLGSDELGGRAVSKLLLDPKPGRVSGSPATELLGRSRLTLWVESASGAVVRLEAELVRDVLFGGGLLGRIYKGGRVRIEQMEVAPGVWLPRATSYEVRGRKFLFSAESARTVEVGDYRRVGQPAELLPLVRRELSNTATGIPAP